MNYDIYFLLLVLRLVDSGDEMHAYATDADSPLDVARNPDDEPR
jgi:hypothetical protein